MGSRSLTLSVREIGQTVVVRKGCVVAVEAVEGTDDMLRRAGSLAKRGAVVVSDQADQDGGSISPRSASQPSR